MRRRATLLTLTIFFIALASVVAGPASARTGAAHPATIATFSAGEYGSFAEGMAADHHGGLWVSLTTWGLYDETTDPPVVESNLGQILRVAPDGTVKVKASIDLTPYGMLLGVAVRDDQVYVALTDFGAETISPGVYRVQAGKLKQVVVLPEGAWPNGLAFHGRYLYVTDSGIGAVWRARAGAGAVTLQDPWLESGLLAPGDPETDTTAHGIGANGIAFRGETMFVSVSDSGRIIRVPIRRTGRPGTPALVIEEAALKTADGIAFDAFGGLWVVTNAGTTGESPGGGLYRVTRGAGLWTIADDPGWLNYPTTPVFGAAPGTRRTLFIENGAYGSWGDGTTPDVCALRVAIPGLPVW